MSAAAALRSQEGGLALHLVVGVGAAAVPESPEPLSGFVTSLLEAIACARVLPFGASL